MAFSKSVQLVPAGARQVGPGIFQMTRRGGSRGGHKHKQKHTRRALPMMSQSFVRYVRLLNSFRQVARSFTAPDWLNVPALLLYMHGQNKHDKGAMNVAKTMLLDQAAQRQPQIAALLNAGAGDLGMLGLLGGGLFGGQPLGGAVGSPQGPRVIPQSDAGDGGFGGGGIQEITQDVNDARDLIEAIRNQGGEA